MALLWASHTPALHHTASLSLLALVVLHIALFVATLAFWICILNAASSRWHALLALLVCGKPACLLGVLLIFAPRLLLAARGSVHAMHHMPGDHVAALADQHLAGLLMVAACP
jgi:putative membrane protein